MGKRLKCAVKLGKLAAGIGVAVACPPAGAALGAVAFLKGARKFAKSGNPRDAQGMITGYGGIFGGKSSN